jgi:hypothetical protein
LSGGFGTCGAVAILAAALVLAGALPALADVCDKVVGPGWRPEHGAPVLLGLGMVPTVALAALFAVGTVAGWLKPWFALVLGGIVVVLGAFGIADLTADHRIVQAARAEGCRAMSADLVCLGAGFAVFAAGFFRRFIRPLTP